MEELAEVLMTARDYHDFLRKVEKCVFETYEYALPRPMTAAKTRVLPRLALFAACCSLMLTLVTCGRSQSGISRGCLSNQTSCKDYMMQ